MASYLSTYEFQYGLDKDITKGGSPDLKYRSFSVFLPSERNNTIQVVNYDVKEQQNVNIAPIPQVALFNPNINNFENIYYTYNKNAEYSQNKFLPENIAELSGVGPLRDMVTGNIIINPFQYNPVTKTSKYYSRIRIRINFGDSPFPLNRPRSREEVSLLSNSGINFNIASNWLNPKFKNAFKDRLVSNSVLSTGDWYKIEIKDDNAGNSEGIYKITKSFLENAGINLNGIDPRTIKMYGNGGDLLEERMSLPRPEDLLKMPYI